MAGLDFSQDTEIEEDEQLEIKAPSKSEKTEQKSSEDDFLKGQSESLEKDDEIDLENSAINLYEDDNFIFTSEGVIEKASLKKQDNSSDAEPKKDDEKILGKFENYDDLAKSYKELESKLGQNSDAVNKLRELNPVLPMLEAMLGDETFLQMAEDYFTDPSAQSEAFKKQLGINEDFVFDLNNALSDPKSDDAKVLNKLMQAKQPKSNQQKQPTSQVNNDAEKKAIMDKFSMSEDDYKDMMKKAEGYKISHEDIYYLINKDKVLSEAERRGQEAIKKQVNTAQKLRKSPSGGTELSDSPEDIFMKSISRGGGLFDD